jgi:hypothetical protein
MAWQNTSVIVCVATAATALCLATPVLAQAPPDGASDTADGVDLGTDLSLSPDWASSGLSASAVEIDRGGDEGGELDTSLDFSMAMFHDPDPEKPTAGEENLANAATNPVAPLIQLQFQNTSNFKTVDASGYGNTFVVQPVIPWKIGSWDQQFISRITFPLLVASADPDGPMDRQYGCGDMVAINFANFPIKDDFWGGTLALGVGLTFPTASNDFLGEGKYQAGPGVFYINTSTPKIQWGFLIYQQWSYADKGGGGDHPDVSKLFGQPLLNWHFAPGWYTGLGDILWHLDWEDNNQWSIPLSVRLGHITKMFGHQPVNIFIEPFYNVMTPDAGGTEWGIKLSLTLLFPE